MKVKIYQPSKTATQSGKKSKNWILEPIASNHKSIDDVMGWTSSDDTQMQIKLTFQDKEEAAKYAQSQNWEYEILEPTTPKVIKKSYANNFV